MALEWKRLTRHAQRAVLDAQELAASLGSDVVKPRHLLAALAENPLNSAVMALQLCAVPPEQLRGLLEDHLEHQLEQISATDTSGKPAIGAEVRAVAEAAALRAGTGPIGTELLLRSLLEKGDSLSETLQNECGLSLTELDTQIARLEDHELRLDRGPTGASSRTAAANGANDAPAPADAVRRTPAAVPPASTEGNPHTLLALSRLILDLSFKAARAAVESGNTALAAQLENLRSEVEAQMQRSRPVSLLSVEGKGTH